MEEVVPHAVDHGGRDLGTARPVEVGHRMAAVLPAERGKLLADDLYWRYVRHSGNKRWSQRRNILASSVASPQTSARPAANSMTDTVVHDALPDSVRRFVGVVR
jgi:hypothetical protein